MKTEPSFGISVIICSRNDLVHLQHNMLHILAQNYPTYEVIVVNDASTDDTDTFLRSTAEKNKHLKIVDILNKTTPGKKHALKMGIEAAQYPFILLTDADCMPSSNLWIRSNASFAREKNTVLLGYGKYKKQSGFLNRFIRFDTANIAIQYMSRALWKYPYMGVGRNIGYSKNIGDELNNMNTTIASGDDDLIVQATAKKSVFLVNLESDGFTTSIAKKTWSEWLNQKGRHTTTAPHYTLFNQIWLFSQWALSMGFYLGIIIILLTGQMKLGLILLALNTLSIALFNGLWLRKLGENDLILLSPLLDFIYTFVQPIFVFKSWGRKKDEWN